MYEVRLPAEVRVLDVLTAAGLLSGAEMRRDGMHGAVEAAGTKIRYTPCPEMLQLDFTTTVGDSLCDGWSLFYHLEGCEDGRRLISPPETGFFLALGRCLVRFFGGEMAWTSYRRCMQKDRTLSMYPKGDGMPIRGTNEDWDFFQSRLASIEMMSEDLEWGEKEVWPGGRREEPYAHEAMRKQSGPAEWTTSNGGTPLFWVPQLGKYVTVPED